MSLDSGGSVPQIEFQIVVAVPSIASPTGATITLTLILNIESPCRTAVFSSQTIPDITAGVYGGAK